MLYDHKLARDRVAQCITTVVEPARFTTVCDLAAAVYQCEDPCTCATAAAAQFKPVQPGFRWGPIWSTAWFKLSGAVPADTPADRLYFFFDTATEACLWQDGVPYHGLSKYHKFAPLNASFIRGGRVELLVEAAANFVFGMEGWKQRFPDDQIARFTEARLALVLPEVCGLYHDMKFALELADALDADAPRRRTLIFALNAAVNVINPLDVPGTAAAARALLKPALSAPASASATTCHASGHSHIDTAWLWPLRETRRKCYRTFSTALRNMERYPEFQFQQGQAQLYAFVQEDHPKLFEAIKQRVQEGRWDAGGAMWVEPDMNVPSGEALIRQILLGTRYWQREFGVSQTYLWLPDTFGYTAALPQILVQAGLRAFFTQKLTMNQFNRFPHHTFRWEGLDGTSMLAHMLPGENYNCMCTAAELRRAERNFRENDRCHQWLHAYGYGDGGGGPHVEMFENLRRAANCEELPRVKTATVRDFIPVLEKDAQHLPTWSGELYFEFHRGTLTTQAANKRDNRKCELALRDAEMLHALAPQGRAGYPAEALDRAWKTLLLHQFHDILPGSSITWVYKDSAAAYAKLTSDLRGIVAKGERAWAAAADTSGAQKPVVALNTLNWSRTEVVELPAERGGDGLAAVEADTGAAVPLQNTTTDGQTKYLALLRDVNPIGHRVFDVAKPSGAAASFTPVKATPRSLENEWVRYEFDDAGRVVSVVDKRNGRQALRPGQPANQLVLYEDRSTSPDAWDFDIFYLEKGEALNAPAEITLVESGPLRATLRIARAIGTHSKMVQHVRLTCASARLDFETWVDWRADREMLRARFPVDVRSDFASYHIQHGVIRRPTHFNTSWDYAKFEVAGHHWADLSEPNYGVSVLSESKYGYSCHGSVLGITLLRATTSPDPVADRGEHRFTYSLLPHVGDWRSGGVLQAGYQLNVPLRLVAEAPHAGPRGKRFSAMTSEAPNLVIDAIKKAEDDNRLIVRMFEAFGQHSPTSVSWDPALGAPTPVDLLERPAAASVSITRSAAGRLECQQRPFGLLTVVVG